MMGVDETILLSGHQVGFIACMYVIRSCCCTFVHLVQVPASQVKVAVFGGGNFGTAMACVLGRKGVQVLCQCWRSTRVMCHGNGCA